jgi:hypothetical protein
MAVDVNGMLLERDQSESGEALSPDAGTRDTHRSADGTTRNGQFNALVRLETVDAAFGE